MFDKTNLPLLLTISLLITWANKSFGQVIEYQDKIYSTDIKTVRLFPLVNQPDQDMYPSAAPLNSAFPLILEFDHLYAEYESHYVKLIHCNADWSPSRLHSFDYLDEFNEFQINDYDFSFNTLVPYIHYTFEVPRVKVSGNYILYVYRDREENPVLTKRFMIFDNRVQLVSDFGTLGQSLLSKGSQELQFKLNYRGIRLDNPHRNVRATIKQNQRWDNAVYGLTSTFINEGLKEMDFRHFAGENQFKAGNQFRFFDMRSLQYFGRNVETVDIRRQTPLATLQTDVTRATKAYSEYQDRNGKYTIPHPTDADYAQVEFFLQSDQLGADVYVVGDFTQWSHEDVYKLEYIEGRKGYYGQQMMKQGYYDYQYLVKGGGGAYSPNHFEGNYFQTENEYEILIYYYSFEMDTDLLIGYFNITANPRF